MDDTTGGPTGRLVMGERVGRLLRRGSGALVLRAARCSCGRECVVVERDVLRGHTTSCGHAKRVAGFTSNLRHGATSGGDVTPEYRVWEAMVRRCENPADERYADYGGRGITVCARWRKTFAAFLTDMGRRPSARHSIDRIDTNGNYEPGNCRWATQTTQQRNRRNNRLVTHDGETLCVAAWAERTGISRQTICERLDAGWTPERALTTPPRVVRRGSAA